MQHKNNSLINLHEQFKQLLASNQLSLAQEARVRELIRIFSQYQKSNKQRLINSFAQNLMKLLELANNNIVTVELVNNNKVTDFDFKLSMLVKILEKEDHDYDQKFTFFSRNLRQKHSSLKLLINDANKVLANIKTSKPSARQQYINSKTESNLKCISNIIVNYPEFSSNHANLNVLTIEYLHRLLISATNISYPHSDNIHAQIQSSLEQAFNKISLNELAREAKIHTSLGKMKVSEDTVFLNALNEAVQAELSMFAKHEAKNIFERILGKSGQVNDQIVLSLLNAPSEGKNEKVDRNHYRQYYFNKIQASNNLTDNTSEINLRLSQENDSPYYYVREQPVSRARSLLNWVGSFFHMCNPASSLSSEQVNSPRSML